MSRAARRTVSWLACSAALGAAALAVWALPGGPPAERELRWLLAHGGLQSREYLRAATLLRRVEGEGGPGADAMLRELLDDSRYMVVASALRLLGDRLGVEEQRDGAAEMFANWWHSATPDTRILHLSTASRCWLMARELHPMPADDRWRVVFVVHSVGRPDEEWLPFVEPERGADAPWVRRLRALGSLEARGTTAELPKRDAIAAGPGSERLAEMLDDPNTVVAQAAARLLAVCGDARGIPGTLASIRPRSMERLLADEVLGELFGPEWRSLDAGGGAAGEPGAGDGGG